LVTNTYAAILFSEHIYGKRYKICVAGVTGHVGRSWSRPSKDSIHYAPYVAGTLLAAEKVPAITGLVRGMDTLLGLNAA
jgi:hypothetical protein